MSEAPMKLHTQKGKRRLWLEEQKYGLPGFTPVGIHNSRLKELFGDTENGVDTPVSYEMSEGYIKIMPVAS